MTNDNSAGLDYDAPLTDEELRYLLDTTQHRRNYQRAFRQLIALRATPASPAMEEAVAWREALVESQSLLVAMLHEQRPAAEIEAQLAANRAALSATPASPAMEKLLDGLSKLTPGWAGAMMACMSLAVHRASGPERGQRVSDLMAAQFLADNLPAVRTALYASQPQHLGEVKVTDELEKAKAQAIDLLLTADQVWEDYGSGFRIHFSFLPNTSMNVVERIHTAISLASSPRGDR